MELKEHGNFYQAKSPWSGRTPLRSMVPFWEGVDLLSLYTLQTLQ